LDYVIADVGHVFAEAQLYVALSRASDESGLELRNFSKNRVRVNPLALHFHDDPTRQVPFWWEGPGGGSVPKIMATPVTGSRVTSVRKRPSRLRNGTTQPTPKGKTKDVDQMLQLLKQDNASRKSRKAAGSSVATPSYDQIRSKAVDARALEAMTVEELKQMLRIRGLKVSGKKAELIDRLVHSRQS
jgi:hypothetical protein